MSGREAAVTAAIRALLARHGLADRNARLGPGSFADSHTQVRYDHLMRRGCIDRLAAVDVVSEMLGATVTLIDAALPRMPAPDVRQIYVQLCATTLRQSLLVQAWSLR